MNVLNLKSELSKDLDIFGNPLFFALCYFQNSRRRNFEFCAANENYFQHKTEHVKEPILKAEIDESYSILSEQKDIRNFHKLPLVILTDFGVWKITEIENRFYPKIKIEKLHTNRNDFLLGTKINQ